jgi:hypothetical protein
MPRYIARYVAIALSLLLVWFLVGDRPAVLDTPPAAAPDSTPARSTDADAEIQQPIGTQALAQRAHPVDAAETRVEVSTRIQPSGPVTLHGRVLLEDEHGMLREPADCLLELCFECLVEPVDVQPIHGLWTMNLGLEAFEPQFLIEGGLAPKEDLGALEVWSILIGDRPALVSEASFAVFQGQETVITCRWPQATLLRVVARESGGQLDAVDIAMAEDWFELMPVSKYDLENALVVRGEPSPISFAPDFEEAGEMFSENSLPWWVGAEGYGWERVIIDHRQGGERTVELTRAGSLELTLLGDWPETTTVYLAPQFGPLAHEDIVKMSPAGAHALRASRLPPGIWNVAVRSGLDWRLRATLVEEQISITSGETTHLELEVPALRPLADPVPLGGILEVPAAWMEMGTLTFFLQGLDDMPHDHQVLYPSEHSSLARNTEVSTLPRVGDDIEQRRWHGGRRHPGRYAAEVSLRGAGCLWRQEFELGPEGNEELLLVMPAPAQIHIVVVDAETSRRLLQGCASPKEAGVWFSFRGKGGQSMSTPLYGEVNAGTGAFVAALPVGPVELSVDATHYGWEILDVQVRPGGNEVIVPMTPLVEIQVTLVSAGRAVTVPESWAWEVELTDLEGEEIDMGCEISRDRPNWMNFLVPNVGTCRLVFPEVNGYERPATIEVRLDPVHAAELILNLRPK